MGNNTNNPKRDTGGNGQNTADKGKGKDQGERKGKEIPPAGGGDQNRQAQKQDSNPGKQNTGGNNKNSDRNDKSPGIKQHDRDAQR